jgi:prepilin-type N-terminal cleavage/methylation domain-containing protein/prepilin-type processing-associated H-X9-DG protein
MKGECTSRVTDRPKAHGQRPCPSIINYPSSIISRNAFTLMELLVVISILAMLVSILLPTVERVRRQARAVACQAKLGQWGTLLAAQMLNNPEEHILRPYWKPGGHPDDFDQHYGRDVPEDLYLCPMASRLAKAPDSAPGSSSAVGSTFTAFWVADDGFRWATSYGVSRTVIHSPEERKNNGFGFADLASVKGAISASVPFMADCICNTITVGPGFDKLEPPAFEDVFFSPGSGDWPCVCIDRHNSGVNCLFLDWSVRKVGLKELWTLKWNEGFDPRGPWTRAGGVKPEDWPPWMRRFKDY